MTFKFRKGTNQGLWCIALLPFCLWYFVMKYDSGIQFLCFNVCWCAPLSYFLKEKIDNKYCNKNNRCCMLDFLLPIPFSILMLSAFPWSISYIVFFVVIWYYANLVTNLLKYCPGTFTLGEVQIIAQAIILFFTYSLCSLVNRVSDSIIFPIFIPESVICSQVLVTGSLFLIHSLCMFPVLRQGIYFFPYAALISFLMLYVWNILLKRDIFSWILLFCIQDNTRICLILFWVICTSASILFVIIVNTTPNKKVSTITRKYFHLIITSVYVPGIIWDLELLQLASAIAFSVFIVLEVCRVLDIPLISVFTKNAFQIFLDEKDSGILILTHIYLLVGCSSSIWLLGYAFGRNGYHICLFSGIISVGIGDTAAAVGGTLFGRHQWENSKKTYEGTICAFATQLIFSLYFLYIGHNFSLFNVMLIIITVLLTSLLEAKTTQVDNLVLPLFMFSFLCWIS